jgi:DNA repair protein RadC
MMKPLPSSNTSSAAPSLRVLREAPAERVLQDSTTASLLEVVSVLVGDPDVALRVLAQFPTLRDMQQARPAELAEIDGLGPRRIAAIKAALEIGRRLLRASGDDRAQIRSPADAAQLLIPEMNLLEQEQLRVVLLDTRMRVIAMPVIYVGNLNSTIVRTAEVFREAIRQNASAIIVAHNHPSGDSSPSPEDVVVTRNIIAAGQLLDIDVMDHLIISGQGGQIFASLKERGLAFE